jgi:hypothetical protein
MWSLRLAQYGPHRTRSCSVAATRDDDLSRLVHLGLIPIEMYLVSSTGSRRCGQRYTRNGGPMWSLRLAQLGPHHDAHEVAVSLLREMTI